MYMVVLRNLKNPNEYILLDELTQHDVAQMKRKEWRKALGGDKKWTVDRRKGLDTFGNLLSISVMEKKFFDNMVAEIKETE